MCVSTQVILVGLENIYSLPHREGENINFMNVSYEHADSWHIGMTQMVPNIDPTSVTVSMLLFAESFLYKN